MTEEQYNRLLELDEILLDRELTEKEAIEWERLYDICAGILN